MNRVDEFHNEQGAGGIKLRGGRNLTADETGGRSTGVRTGFGSGRFGGGGGVGGGGTRVVVKANYTRTGSARGVKASARYYSTRENDRGEALTRGGFANDHDNLTRAEINERLGRADAEHAYHYRLALSPGTDRDAEGVDLGGYTRKVMNGLERRQHGPVSWVAFVHAGDAAHTERAHVHIIAATDRQLDRNDFAALREVASRTWDDAKDVARAFGRDQAAGQDVRDMAAALARFEARRNERSPERTAQKDRSERPPEDGDVRVRRGRGRE